MWVLLLEGRPGVAYNVGGSESVSIAELARLVVHAAGSASAIEVRKQPVQGAPIELYVPDVSLTLAELSLPPPLSLDESIARTVQWFKEGGAPRPTA